MRKEYEDQSGNVWERYDNEYVKKPAYEIPHNVPEKINSCILSWVDPMYSEYTFQLVPITLFSVPMWVKNDDNITSSLQYSYSVCYCCGNVAQGPVQICALLLICKYQDDTFSFTKRAVIRCVKCNPNILVECSYFGFILTAQRALNGPLNHAWTTFSPEYMRTKPMEYCYVCGQENTRDVPICNLEQCQKEYRMICTVSGDPYGIPHTQECMQDFLWHCYSERLDIVSDFLGRVCYNPMCRKIIRPPAIAFACDQCCRVLYCSEKCLNTHIQQMCEPMEHIWLRCIGAATRKPPRWTNTHGPF